MITLSLHSGLLAATQTLGLLWLFFLFSFCFFGVHAVKLIGVGWSQYKKKTPPPPPPKQEEKAPAKQEPIYYIVERKRRARAPRTTYGEPKEISFK